MSASLSLMHRTLGSLLHYSPVAVGLVGGAGVLHPCSAKPCCAQEEPLIPEKEIQCHRSPEDAWVSFNEGVYNITKLVPQHPECKKLSWAERVAGRRLEHFLGRDALGTRCIKYCEQWPLDITTEDMVKCSNKDVRAAVEHVLQPYRIGKLEPAPLSEAAQAWPDVDPSTLQLSVERADGKPVGVATIVELRRKYPVSERRVTHVCSNSGQENTQCWVGVRVCDLLPENNSLSWDPLVTFVGMDGFGYSMFRSRAEEDDVLLAYERDGKSLETEQGGPLRLVKNGQHAKWVERVIIEG